MNTDGILSTQEIVFLVVFGLLVFVVPILVVWASYSKNTHFDVSSLWVHQGRIDKFAVIVMCSWWVHTCVILLSALRGNVSTGDLTSYTAWAVPLIFKMFAPSAEASSINGTRLAGAPPDPSQPASQK